MEIVDYLQEGDVGFKKPKTKKKRPTRRVIEESDIQPVNDENKMDIDEKPVIPRARNLDANFVDDDELQASLARARRTKTLKKPKVLTQEEIARKRMYSLVTYSHRELTSCSSLGGAYPQWCYK